MNDIGTVKDIIEYYKDGGERSVIVDSDCISLYGESGTCIFKRFGSSINQIEPFLEYLDIPNSSP